MELKNFFAQDLQGNVIPSPTVYIYQPGTTTLATGLQNAAGAALTNPFTGTANGQVTVAAPDGEYDMRVTGAGRDTTMRVRFISVSEDAVAAAEAAAQTATEQAQTATTQAGLATTNGAAQVALAAQQATLAASAKTAAEAARDAATVNALVYATVAAGLAATTPGQQFQVVAGLEIIRYRHDVGTVAVVVARYPTADVSLAAWAAVSSEIIVQPTLALLPVATAGRLAVVYNDVIGTATSVTRFAAYGGETLVDTALAHGLAVGDQFSVRNVPGFNGRTSVMTVVSGTRVRAIIPGTPQATTAVQGALDRNGVYVSDGAGWHWMADLGADSARVLLRARRAIEQPAAVPAPQLGALLTRQQLLSTNEVTSVEVYDPALTADRRPLLSVDGLGLSRITRTGQTIRAPYTAPAVEDYSVDVNYLGAAGADAGRIAVSTARRINQDVSLWTRTRLTVAGGQADPLGGSSAYLLTCDFSATAVTHLATSPAFSALPVNGGFEIWCAPGTVGLVFLSGDGATDHAYVDLVTGDIQRQNMDAAIVERRGEWCKIWMSKVAGVTANTQMRVYPVQTMGVFSFISAGTETVRVFSPRQSDGPLPMLPHQRGSARAGSVAYANRLQVRSSLNNGSSDANTDYALDVVVPDSYTPSQKYPVLYILEPAGGASDGLQVAKTLGLHNRHNCILVRPMVRDVGLSWWGSSANGDRQHDRYLTDVAVSMVDARYSTIPSRNGRLLLGFSKSGWGATSLLLRESQTFGYAAVWDVPWGIKVGGTTLEIGAGGTAVSMDAGQSGFFGTQAQMDLYDPSLILAARKRVIMDRPRLIVGGSVAWPRSGAVFSALLAAERIPHLTRMKSSHLSAGGVEHAWVTGNAQTEWLTAMSDMLFIARGSD